MSAKTLIHCLFQAYVICETLNLFVDQTVYMKQKQSLMIIGESDNR